MMLQILALVFQVLIIIGFALLLKRGASIKAWQDFLDSLSTKGGNIFMLFFCLFALFSLMLHITHDTATDAGLVSVVHDLTIAFGGALLGSLSGSSSRQQMADRVQTATMGAQTPVPPPGGVATTTQTTQTTVADK